MVTADKIYTVEQFNTFAQQHPDKLLQLIHGRIVEKVTSEEHGSIGGNILAELRQWKRQNNIQGFYSMEASVELSDDDKNYRRPDVSFRLTTGEIGKQGTLKEVPQFVVEVKSPTDNVRALREKAQFYLDNGAKLVWLIYPSQRIVEVYHEDGTVDLFDDEALLSGGSVLRGFEMSASDIFEV